MQALNTFKQTVGDINLETRDSIVTTTYTVCVLTRSQPHTWCVCSQNLIQKIERAAQQKASATILDWTDRLDAQVTDEKTAFPREQQTTDKV